MANQTVPEGTVDEPRRYLRWRSVALLGALLGALALVAAACGGGDDDADDDGDSATATTAAASSTDEDDDHDHDEDDGHDHEDEDDGHDDDMGDDDAAPTAVDRTGETIKVGYINNEGGALSLPEFRTGGEVAIGLINDQGGIHGAQIEIVTCLSDVSPEGAINCANEMIEADVDMVYVGIELASEAIIGILGEAEIGYFSSHSWGSTERNSDHSFLLHTAGTAYSVGPIKTFKDLGHDYIGVVLEDNPAGRDFMATIIRPVAEHNGLEVFEISVDPAAPDWAGAIAAAQSAGVQALWGQLTEPGCIGMVGAAAAANFTQPVFAGSCSVYRTVLGDAAVGSYTQSDVYFPSVKSAAPEDIQERITEYEEAMTAAGYADHIEGFAVAPYSAWREIAGILETIEGEINAQSIIDAFANAGPTEGWMGPPKHCGGAPWPSESSHCGSHIAVWQVVKNDDGSTGLQLVTDFFDAFPESGF